MQDQQSGSMKYPCPSCGAQMKHDAAKGMLKCEFCGHRQEIRQETPAPEADSAPALPEAKEYDLTSALSGHKFSRGWGTETRSVKCKSCGAISDYPLNVSANNCAFCGSAQIVEEKIPEDVISPETLIPFQVDKNKALEEFRKWLGTGFVAFFRPGELKKYWTLGKVTGAYLPFWTFDAQTHTDWKAEAGYYYYETEYVNGKERQIQRTRWETVWGTHDEFFNDEQVLASQGLDRQMVDGISPYDTSLLVPYKNEYLAGYMAERYTIGLEDGWRMGMASITEKIRSTCDRKVPGDTHRGLQVSIQWSGLTFKHVLLPIWIASYEYKGKVYRFIVNGQNGKVDGEAPISWIKVTAAVIALLGIIGVIVYFAMRQS